MQYEEERKGLSAKIAELEEGKSYLSDRNQILEKDIKIALSEIERQRAEYQEKAEAVKQLF